MLAVAGFVLAGAGPTASTITVPARDGIPAHDLRVLTWQAKPGPLLVYQPGWSGRANEAAPLAASLAEAGFTVAAVDYATAQPPAFAAGLARLAEPMDLSSDAALARTVALGDWRAVLMAADSAALLDRAHEAAAGILGWSFGGAVASEACRQDPRWKACLNMDGWMFGPAADSPPSQPYMLLSGDPYPAEPHPARDPASILDERDAARLRARFARTGGIYAHLAGRKHDDFTGNDNAVRVLVQAFFTKTLLGQPAPLLDQHLPLPGVTLRRFPGPAG